MRYDGEDEDEDKDGWPEAPPIQMITETFSQVKVTPEGIQQNHQHDKE